MAATERKAQFGERHGERIRERCRVGNHEGLSIQADDFIPRVMRSQGGCGQRKNSLDS